MIVPIHLVLIGRQGCHLCEDAQNVLAQVVARFAHEHPGMEYVVEDLDIDQDENLRDKYAEEIPVLLLNGRAAGMWRLDADRVYELILKELV
jgi:glutaredoxin